MLCRFGIELLGLQSSKGDSMIGEEMQSFSQRVVEVAYPSFYPMGRKAYLKWLKACVCKHLPFLWMRAGAGRGFALYRKRQEADRGKIKPKREWKLNFKVGKKIYYILLKSRVLGRKMEKNKKIQRTYNHAKRWQGPSCWGMGCPSYQCGSLGWPYGLTWVAWATLRSVLFTCSLR